MTLLRKTLSELNIAETPLATLEGEGAFFALLPEELVYRDKTGIHRVELLALTRIHSETTKVLHFETSAGRLFSAALAPFKMPEVQDFFQRLGELTKQIKAGGPAPSAAPKAPEAIVIGDPPPPPPAPASRPPEPEIGPQARQDMRVKVSQSVASQKKPVWAQSKSAEPSKPATSQPEPKADKSSKTNKPQKAEKAEKTPPRRLSEEEATLALWRWPKRLRLLGAVLLVLSLVALAVALWRGLSTSSILFVAMVAILFSLGGDLLGWWLAKNTNAAAPQASRPPQK